MTPNDAETNSLILALQILYYEFSKFRSLNNSHSIVELMIYTDNTSSFNKIHVAMQN